jgi:hypothetical protein
VVTPRYFAGLDLGPAGEFTALAVLEQTRVADERRPGAFAKHYALRHLARWPPGTSYTTIADEIRPLYAAPPLAHSTLVVDVTGVGRSVLRLFTRGGIQAHIRAVFMTAGHKPADDSADWSVPKVELAGVIQMNLQARRLKVAKDLADAATLVKELTEFRIKPKLADADSTEAWREGLKDDLVFAVGIGLWVEFNLWV